jgi:bifunctional DNA-binding transcriptional regulator/antitoxin component of YhaV-PrlF toxin-antitoxin module
MTKKTFSSTVSEQGQCIIPAPLRKRLQLLTGEELVFWINERGHLEAEPAHMARSRSYRTFNTEADAIADSLSFTCRDFCCFQAVQHTPREA